MSVAELIEKLNGSDPTLVVCTTVSSQGFEENREVEDIGVVVSCFRDEHGKETGGAYLRIG